MLQPKADLSYKQETPSKKWTIVHNLGRNVVTDVFIPVDGIMTKILPYSVQILDINTVEISFTRPFSGECRIA